MLVLSRKKNESIVINNDITVTVVKSAATRFGSGSWRAKEVPVHRQEVYEAIHGKSADEGVRLALVVSRSSRPITDISSYRLRRPFLEWGRVFAFLR